MAGGVPRVEGADLVEILSFSRFAGRHAGFSDRVAISGIVAFVPEGFDLAVRQVQDVAVVFHVLIVADYIGVVKYKSEAA